MGTSTPAPPDATPVVVARRLSAGSRTFLAERGMSWADEAGGLDLAAGPILIRIPTLTPPTETARARFTAAAGAVAEHLLHRATSGETLVPLVSDLAAAVGASPGAISRALTYFDAQGWTARTGARRGPTSRRDVVERGALLDGWATWYAARPDDVVTAHALIREPDTWLADVLAPAWPRGSWAVTGLVALQHRAPLATATNPVDLYLEGTVFDLDLRDVLAAAELTPTDTGARVRVLRADRYTSPLLRAARDEEVPLVSDVRLYGDLLRRGGVRAEEYAMHLREQRIGF
ncbi:type IV toxin-antitoxin system AbiEi family antitoxin [Cellulomonas phragmiteti]|uniref:type IV toxin-antitoxin system AbiEi family antitoxin n=1 Tax=Cellulomonas phragmiteti TaxID=478780 RepID=UPI001940DBE7|nr:type IV toxin-antitoxin system AbiEi family antitoxin [Cellulomonas phragmiteti]